MCIVSLLVYQFVFYYLILYLGSTECLLISMVGSSREIQRRCVLQWNLEIIFRWKEGGGNALVYMKSLQATGTSIVLCLSLPTSLGGGALPLLNYCVCVHVINYQKLLCIVPPYWVNGVKLIEEEVAIN